MDYMNWNQTYSVQLEEFDKQHQGLITILNVLSETELAASFKSARLFVAIMQLKEYEYQHFTSEETTASI